MLAKHTTETIRTVQCLRDQRCIVFANLRYYDQYIGVFLQNSLDVYLRDGVDPDLLEHAMVLALLPSIQAIFI